MCYNYSLDPQDQKLLETLKVGKGSRKPFKREDLKLMGDEPYYHVSGFTHPDMPVVYEDEYTGLSWDKMRWGLIMPWARTEADLYKLSSNPLNSRDDSVFEKPSYNYHGLDIVERRCIVPMTGFYDSYARTSSDNYPFYIRLKSRELFFVGGIWRRIKNPITNEQVQCFSMVTTGPNEKMRLIHNKKQRMLSILPEGSEDLWLADGLSPSDIQDMIQPYPDEDMYAHPIDKKYNNSRVFRNEPEAFDEVNYDKLAPLMFELSAIA